MVIIIYEVRTNFSRFSFLIFLFRNFYFSTALPRRFFYNFGSLSLQIVKLAFHWRWIFAFVAGRTCCCDPDLSRFRSSSYQGVIAQNHVFFFLFWPGHSQKNAFSKRATLRFSRVYFYRCHPGDHRKPDEKFQCKGSWGVGWGQGEIVCEGY